MTYVEMFWENFCLEGFIRQCFSQNCLSNKPLGNYCTFIIHTIVHFEITITTYWCEQIPLSNSYLFFTIITLSDLNCVSHGEGAEMLDCLKKANTHS